MEDPVQVNKAVEQVRSMLEDQPELNIREAAFALDISRATVHSNLRKCLFIYPYKPQNFFEFQNSDKMKRLQFA